MPENAAKVPSPDPNEKLVKVFDSEQETEVMVVKGLLESAGIESDMTSVDAVQDLFPGVGGTVLLVREEDAALAKQTIEEYRNSAVESEVGDETAEISGASVEVEGNGAHEVGTVGGGVGLLETGEDFGARVAVSVAKAAEITA